MAFVTYILLSAFLSGIQGHFSPENFSVTASYAFAVVIFEMVAIKLGCYLLSIGGQGQVLDLVAYGGYKFVGIVVTMLVRLAGILGRREGEKKGWGRWVEWSVFMYCFLGLGFFMVRFLGISPVDCSYVLCGTLFYPMAQKQSMLALEQQAGVRVGGFNF